MAGGNTVDTTLRLKKDRDRGEYREEVEKIVDGVVEDINSCKVLSQSLARLQAATAARQSAYATDPAFFAATLEHGTHPSAYLQHVGSRPATAPVPWQEMAAACVALDVTTELERRPEFLALKWI